MELCEVIQKSRVDSVRVLKNPLGGGVQVGSLALTGHHIIFSPNSGTVTQAKEIWLLHKSVDRVLVESSVPSSSGSYPNFSNNQAEAVLTLKCKNFLICSFEFAKYEDCSSVGKSIEFLSNITKSQLLYPFFYHSDTIKAESRGWDAFPLKDELLRIQKFSDYWRISDINKDFKISPTYPQRVIVPKSISDEVIRQSADYRDGGRFPVLSYYHEETKSALVRCSQPMVGPNQRRCREDEALLNSYLNSVGYLFDLRSQYNAQAAKNKGGGYEQDIYYPHWKRFHFDIPRWTQYKDSLTKMVEICNDSSISSDRWLSKLNSAGWLKSVSEILMCSCVVAQCIDREGEAPEVSVVVHGTEGMDSTLQITSLVQIILSPRFRTLRGFASLIEREWVEAGHPFALRCSHGPYARGQQTGPYEAPTFLLFLDCLWQIYRQFPCSFEFTEDFLLFIFDHAYSSEWGTFISNNQQARVDQKIFENTFSIWASPELETKYKNPFYSITDSPIWPSVAPQSIVVWDRLFMRWTKDWGNDELIYKMTCEWMQRRDNIIEEILKKVETS